VASEQQYDLAALLAQADAIGDLLAVILGDGGHRQAEVGTAQAAAEALERVHALHQREAERPRAGDLDLGPIRARLAAAGMRGLQTRERRTFLLHAPTDLAALLAEVERLTAERAETARELRAAAADLEAGAREIESLRALLVDVATAWGRDRANLRYPSPDDACGQDEPEPFVCAWHRLQAEVTR